MRSTQRSGVGEDENKYLTSEEIEKLADPKGSLNELAKDLTSKNWEVQVNACNVLRSLAIHDSQLLNSSFFKDSLENLIKIASSLRSSVCKNGLLVFHDLFNNWGRNLEFDLESITNTLIKKGNDTNVFISVEAEKTMLSMCSNCNEQKVLTAVMAHAGNRSASVKEKVAKSLEQIIIKQGKRFKNFREKSRIIDQLKIYLSDASQEVRNNAKQALTTLGNLWGEDELQNITMSEFNPTKQSFYNGKSNRNTRRNFKNGSNASNGFDLENNSKSPSKFGSSRSISQVQAGGEVSKSVSKATPLSYSKRSSMRSNREYGENGNSEIKNNTITVINSSGSQQIKKIYPDRPNNSSNTDTENGSSKFTPNKLSNQRRISKRNIKKLDEKSIPRGPDLSRKTEVESAPLIDERNIFARLKDPDSKVCSKAAEYLISNYNEHKDDIPTNLSIIMNSQATLFWSNNENIKSRAEELIDKWISNEKASILWKPICSWITTANSRAKIMLLEKLNDILPKVAQENPIVLSKHVLPVVYACLDDRSKFIKKKTEGIVLTLYSLIGSALIEFSPSDKLQSILDIIS
jgi:hypothetical protein